MNYAEKQLKAGFTLIPRNWSQADTPPVRPECSSIARAYRRDLFKAKGFTLIEIMIAVAILGILAALTVPAVTGYLAKAKKSSAKSTIKVLEQAITVYNADTGEYPETLRDLVKKPANEKIAANWQEGGYLKKKEVPLDPWNHKYQYQVTPNAENPYELFSYGPKGKGGPKSDRIDVWKI